jgi:hypothetical protein
MTNFNPEATPTVNPVEAAFKAPASGHEKIEIIKNAIAPQIERYTSEEIFEQSSQESFRIKVTGSFVADGPTQYFEIDQLVTKENALDTVEQGLTTAFGAEISVSVHSLRTELYFYSKDDEMVNAKNQDRITLSTASDRSLF